MFFDHLQILFPDQLHILLRHKASLACHGINEAFPLQLLIGALRGDHADAQILGQPPDGRQKVSFL